MLCCVSRKASSRACEKNSQNFQNQKSIVTANSNSSSGFSSSGSSEGFLSSGTFDFTSSSATSNCSSSGFSSATSRFVNSDSASSSSSSSAGSELAKDVTRNFDIFENTSNFCSENRVTVKGSDSLKLDCPRVQARLETFSEPASQRKGEKDIRNEDLDRGEERVDEDEPPVLLPCAICARTFKPESLEVHTKVCERSAIKKRKPFDSAKQRIQGTELAEFVAPKETNRRKASSSYQIEDKITTVGAAKQGTWKQTHDEFLRAIRAARGETIDAPSHRQVMPNTMVTLGVPTRPNEKGMCPTCNRQFSIKSYERHVAWCKERVTKVPMTAATNIAKERLEARMKYRAPLLKNRRLTNREKYSPISAINLPNFASKNSSPPINVRTKESVSSPNCKGGNEAGLGNNHNQKPGIIGRFSTQTREGISSGPMKSRLSDRSNRPTAEIGTTTSNAQSSRPVPPTINVNHRPRILPTTIHGIHHKNSSTSPISTSRSVRKVDHSFSNSTRSQRQNIVNARSHGNPKINDIAINDAVVGMTVQPCGVQKNRGFVTWKQISDEKNTKTIEISKMKSIKHEKISSSPRVSKSEEEIEVENFSWPINAKKLNETYLITESLDLPEIGDKRGHKSAIVSFKDTFWDNGTPRKFNFGGSANDLTSPSRFNADVNVTSSPVRREDKNLIGNFEETNKSMSPVISGRRAKLCPLDLRIIEDDGIFNYVETSRSEKSTVKTCRTSLTKTLPKLAPVECKEILVDKPLNFRARVKNNSETSFSSISLENICRRDLQTSKTLESSRSFGSDENLMRKCRRLTEKNNSNVSHFETAEQKNNEKLATEENFDDDMIINYSNVEDSTLEQFLCRLMKKNSLNISNFGTGEEKNHEAVTNFIGNDFTINSNDDGSNLEQTRRISTKKISKAEKESTSGIAFSFQHGEEKDNENLVTEKNLTSENEEKNISNADGCELTCDGALNFETSGFENNDSLATSKNYSDCDSKINNNENFTSLETKNCLKIRPESAEKNHFESTDESDRIFSALKLSELKISQTENSPVTSRSVPSPKSSQHVYQISPKISTELSSLESPNEKIDKSTKCVDSIEKKVEENSLTVSDTITTDENILSSSVNEIEQPINFQRCGTYVIEKSSNPIVSNKHAASDESPEDKPLHKRRRTEKSSNIPIKTQNQNEKKNSLQIHGSTSEQNNLQMRDVCEKYINEDFYYDSENTLASDNMLADGIRGDSTTNFEEKLLESSCDFPEKSFSDSIITRGKNSLGFSKERMVKDCIGMSEKLKKKMSILRGSTDTLISCVESAGEILNENSLSISSIEEIPSDQVEQETIQELDFAGTGKILGSVRSCCGFLPEIPVDRIGSKSDWKDRKGEKKFCGLDGISLWERARRNSTTRLINLDPPKLQETSVRTTRQTNVACLPSVVPVKFRKEKSRTCDRDSRPAWNNYVRRRPDFNLVLTGRTGKYADYDPFFLAERQMSELLSDTCSDITDSSTNRQKKSSSSPSSPNYPLSHSSAFVKYPDSPSDSLKNEKRVSLIAPPSEFDDLATDFSSDSTETNSISREIVIDGSRAREKIPDLDFKNKNTRELGRRVILDKSKALGVGFSESKEESLSIHNNRSSLQSNDKARKILEKVTPKVIRPNVIRSSSVRASSAPKITERKTNGTSVNVANKINDRSSPSSGMKKKNNSNNNNNSYASLSGSNVSLSSIVSSEADVKLSNFIFDELASSFEDDVSGIYPSLRSLLKNDSLSVSSPVQNSRPRNGQISDEELSSPDGYKRQDSNKLSVDSAYSSLNRKYSNHGRSTTDVAGRLDDDSPVRRRDVDASSSAKSKLSKFCYECGFKFPNTAKFCCECGIKRLAV